jgi:hypothetical protein
VVRRGSLTCGNARKPCLTCCFVCRSAGVVTRRFWMSCGICAGHGKPDSRRGRGEAQTCGNLAVALQDRPRTKRQSPSSGVPDRGVRSKKAPRCNRTRPVADQGLPRPLDPDSTDWTRASLAAASFPSRHEVQPKSCGVQLLGIPCPDLHFVIPAFCRPGRRGCPRNGPLPGPRGCFPEPSRSGKHSAFDRSAARMPLKGGRARPEGGRAQTGQGSAVVGPASFKRGRTRWSQGVTR